MLQTVLLLSCPHLPNIDVTFVSGRLENDDEILDGGTDEQTKEEAVVSDQILSQSRGGSEVGVGGGV